MKSSAIMAALVMAAALTACSYNPYFAGKSAADIPVGINTVRLDNVEIVDNFRLKKNEEPPVEMDPSENDQEVLQVAKNAAIAQLTNFGYRVVDNSTRPAEISVDLYVAYQPERWPLVDRVCKVDFRIADASGGGILDELAVSSNPIGLVGALVGPTRDETVGRATQKAVVLAVNEMKRGTGVPSPVIALPVTSQPYTATQPFPATEPSPAPEAPLESSQPLPEQPAPLGPQPLPQAQPMAEPHHQPES